MALDDISNAFAAPKALFGIIGPLSYRRALGLSQAALGRLLAHYMDGHTYTQATLSTWERIERGVRLPRRYAMTDCARQAYRQLLADVVARAGQGRYRLQAAMGPRRWRFYALARCRDCERWYRVRRAGQVRCARCIRRRR